MKRTFAIGADVDISDRDSDRVSTVVLVIVIVIVFVFVLVQSTRSGPATCASQFRARDGEIKSMVPSRTAVKVRSKKMSIIVV